jgi:hypothetical protein
MESRKGKNRKINKSLTPQKGIAVFLDAVGTKHV